MKSTLFLTVTTMIVLASSVAPIAFAHDATGEAEQRIERRQENKQQIRQESFENYQEKQMERQENKEVKQQEVREHIVRVHTERLTKRFGFYYRRLAGIISKIESRLAILVQEGKDVTLAKAKLAEAKTSLEEAKKYADQAIAAFEEIEPTEYRAENDSALAARDLAQLAREKFIATVVLIRESVQLAKDAK